MKDCENKVLISLQEYNDLLEFKEKTERGLRKVTTTTSCSLFTSIHKEYLTDSKIIEELSEKYDALKSKYNICVENKEDIEKLHKEKEVALLGGKSVRDIKEMTLWEFYKWKKS